MNLIYDFDLDTPDELLEIKQTRFFSGLFHIFNQPFTISGYSSYHSAWQ